RGGGVGGGPPLSAGVASRGSATPTRLPLVPLVRPPAPPVPMRLLELPGATGSVMSLAVPPALVLFATMVLYRATVVEATASKLWEIPPPEFDPLGPVPE